MLLEHQGGGRNHEDLAIDGRREMDLGVGAGPERRSSLSIVKTVTAVRVLTSKPFATVRNFAVK